MIYELESIIKSRKTKKSYLKYFYSTKAFGLVSVIPLKLYDC